MRKILLITGTPARTDTNIGKTLMTLFADFDRTELAQLYFNPEIPNADMCSEYYQICEKQMVKSLLGIRSSCGSTVEPVLAGKKAARPESNPLFLTKYKGNVLMRISREIIWNISHWKNNSLKEWLAQVRPDVIFSIMQDTNAATKAVTWAARYTGCPVVLFVTDDYYHDQMTGWNPARKVYYGKRQKLNLQLSNYVKSLVGCSEKATAFFGKTLNIRRVQTIYTPSSTAYLALPYREQSDDDVVRIRYFGNLGLERWRTLRELGKCIQGLNRDKRKAILEVYSSVTDPVIIKELTIDNGCSFQGWVCGDEYMRLLQEADVVTHVESFNEDMIRRTWISISTKIADYLGAGKCILSIGPEKLASIDHVKDVACTVFKLEELPSQVACLVDSAAVRTEYQKKARKLAQEKHNIEHIKKQMRCLIEGI